jgi:hypothetical protein
MMVGKIFDLNAEGLSNISINRALNVSAETNILAIASDPDKEEIIAATVEI